MRFPWKLKTRICWETYILALCTWNLKYLITSEHQAIFKSGYLGFKCMMIKRRVFTYTWRSVLKKLVLTRRILFCTCFDLHALVLLGYRFALVLTYKYQFCFKYWFARVVICKYQLCFELFKNSVGEHFSALFYYGLYHFCVVSLCIVLISVFPHFW